MLFVTGIECNNARYGTKDFFCFTAPCSRRSCRLGAISVDIHYFTQASQINGGTLPAAAQDTVRVTILMHRIVCQTILSNQKHLKN